MKHERKQTMSVKLNVRQPNLPTFGDFGDFFSPFPSFFAQARPKTWLPAVEVVESADAVDVAVELPGIAAEDVRVNVKDNTLNIDGEKKWEREGDENANVYYAERQYGKFRRSLTLPASVQAESAEASFKDGILRVHLPKVERLRARDIVVTQG